MNNPLGQGAAGGLGDLLGAMMGGGSADGLASLLGKLQQGGLHQEVESWVGKGENLPVAPERLAQALGGDELASLAQRFGGGAASGGAMAGILAQLLPAVINGLTPQGRLPQSQADMGGGLGDVLGSVLSGMMGGQQQQSQGGLMDMLGPLLGAMAGSQKAQQGGGGLADLLGGLLGGAGAATAAGMAGKGGGKVLPPGDALPQKPAALGSSGQGSAGRTPRREDDVDPRNPLGDPGGLFRRR